MYIRNLLNRTGMALAATLLVLASAALGAHADGIEQKDIDIAVVRDPHLGAQMPSPIITAISKTTGSTSRSIGCNRVPTSSSS